MSDDSNYPVKERLRYWQEPGIDKLEELFNNLFPQKNWTKSSENKMVGLCVDHQDTSPSAFVDVERGVYCCSSCGAFYSDLVKLVAETLSLEYTAAFKKVVVVELGLKVSKNREQQLKEFDENQAALKLFAQAANNIFNKAASNPGDSTFDFARGAIASLRSRGIDLEYAGLIGVGVVASRRMMFQHSKANQKAKAHFQKVFVQEGDMPVQPDKAGLYGGHLVFPHFTAPDTFGRLKLRKPDGTGTVWIGPGSEQGFFGFNSYNKLLSTQPRPTFAENIFLVEGEYDLMSFWTRMQKSAPDTIIVSGSGSGVGGVDQLPSFGFERIIAVGDNDEGGDKFNKRIVKQMKDVDSAGVYIYNYPSEFEDGADPDDVVSGGQFQEFKKSLHDESNWQEPYLWATDQIEQHILNNKAVDLSTKLRLARDYGEMLSENLVRDNFIDLVADKLNLDPSHLRRDLASADTAEGFIASLKRVILNLIDPITYTRHDNQDTCIMVYHKGRDDVLELNLDRKPQLLSKMQTLCFDTDLFSWVSHQVGLPELITETTSGKKVVPRSDRQQRKEVEFYFNQAIDSLAAETINSSKEYTHKRQGSHFLDANRTPEPDLPEGMSDRRLVYVNGNIALIGEIEQVGENRFKPKVKYKPLDMPVHSKYIFEKDANAMWNVDVMSAQDLNRPVTKAEARKAIDDCKRMYEEAFTFANPEVDTLFLVYNAVANPILMMADSFPMVAYTGPTTAGKSTCMSLQDGDNPYSIMSHSKGYDDYTVAGLTQVAQGATLTICVEEFENPDDSTRGKRGYIVQDMLETIRNAQSVHGSRVTRGTQHGENRETDVRAQFQASTIHGFSREEDVNRWVTIELKSPKNSASLPPAVIIQNMFARQRFAHIRSILLRYVLQNAGDILQTYYEIKDEIFTQRVIPVPLEASRFVHSVEMIMALQKHFDEDYLGYAKEHSKQFVSTVQQSVISEEDRLFRAIFRSSNVNLPQDDKMNRNVIEVLNDAELAQKLSGSNCGVYYKPGKEYVVINPYAAMAGVLSKTHVYGRTVNSQSIFKKLKVHEHVHYSPDKLSMDDDMMNHLAGFLGSVDPSENLVVYLDDLLGTPKAGDDDKFTLDF